MSSPMQRSLRHLREDGWRAEKVEQWIPRANIRKDLFGIIDVVALKSGEKPLALQVTDASSFSKHRDKIMDCPDLPLILEHFRVVLHGWGKQKVKRGGKAVRYVLREAEFTASDLEYVEWPEVADA